MKKLSKPNRTSLPTANKQVAIAEFLNAISSDELQEHDLPFKLYFNHKLMASPNESKQHQTTKN